MALKGPVGKIFARGHFYKKRHRWKSQSVTIFFERKIMFLNELISFLKQLLFITGPAEKIFPGWALFFKSSQELHM